MTSSYANLAKTHVANDAALWNCHFVLRGYATMSFRQGYEKGVFRYGYAKCMCQFGGERNGLAVHLYFRPTGTNLGENLLWRSPRHNVKDNDFSIKRQWRGRCSHKGFRQILRIAKRSAF